MRPSPESLAFAVLIIYDCAEPTQHLRLNLSPSLPHCFSERKPWPLVAAAYANYLRKKHAPEFLKTILSRGLISFGLFAYATRILTECGKLTKHVPVFVFCFLSSPSGHRCFIWYKSMFCSTQVRNSPDAVMAFNTKFKHNPSKCN